MRTGSGQRRYGVLGAANWWPAIVQAVGLFRRSKRQPESWADQLPDVPGIHPSYVAEVLSVAPRWAHLASETMTKHGNSFTTLAPVLDVICDTPEMSAVEVIAAARAHPGRDVDMGLQTARWAIEELVGKGWVTATEHGPAARYSLAEHIRPKEGCM